MFTVNWMTAQGESRATTTESARQGYHLLRRKMHEGALYADLCTAHCPGCPLVYREV